MSIDMTEVLFNDLVKEINRNNCVVFVGAGLSQEAGLPDWKSFMEDMLNWGIGHGVRLTPEDKDDLKRLIDKGDYRQFAQEMREKMGNSEFLKFMNATFRKDDIKPTKAHELLVQIPFASAITTNYDVLLETAYTQKMGNMPRIYTHKSYPELSCSIAAGSYYILKAHGDIDEIETVILSRKDYQNLLNNTAYCQHMGAVFMQKTVLFIGFDFANDLMDLLDELGVSLREYGANWYALMESSGVSHGDPERFRKNYKINIITCESPGKDHREGYEFLTKLMETCKPEPHSTIQNQYDVFIAEVSSSLADMRKGLIARLAEKKITVHPDIAHSDKLHEYEHATINALKNTRLSIHLLNNQGGDEISGEKETYPQKQAKLGLQHSQSQLVWIHEDVDTERIDDEQQKLLIEELENTEKENYDFQKGIYIDEVLETITDSLNGSVTTEEDIPSHTIPPLTNVLLDTNKIDSDFVLDIQRSLLDKNILPLVNQVVEGPKNRIDAIENLLQLAHAVVIIYGKAEEIWVHSRVILAMNLSVSRKVRIRTICIYLAAPPKKDSISKTFEQDYPLLKLHSLDNQRGFNSGSLEPLYDALKVVNCE